MGFKVFCILPNLASEFLALKGGGGVLLLCVYNAKDDDGTVIQIAASLERRAA